MMSEGEKNRLILLINHWIEHNRAHTESYLDRAKELEFQGLDNVAKHIREASDLVLKANKEFEAAKNLL
jgi:hypothetical protein